MTRSRWPCLGAWTRIHPRIWRISAREPGGIASLAIDLADTQYVSSAGLRVFLFAHKELAKVGSGLTLRHPNEYIADVLDATGFTEILTVEQ